MAEHPDILLFQKCKKFGKDVVEELLATASPEVIQDWQHALQLTKTFYDVDGLIAKARVEEESLNLDRLLENTTIWECMLFQYRIMLKSNNLTEAQRYTLNMLIEAAIPLVQDVKVRNNVVRK
jgi:hypothetical protein